MVFNSDIFLFVFFPIVFILFWSFKAKQARYVILTVASYVFYGYWDWRFCWLLLISSMISFFTAILVDGSPTRRRRLAWMTTSIVIDLTILGFFKYYNFFTSNIYGLLTSSAPPLLRVVLPVGISFYTFHTISYIVDVTQGKVRATRNLFEYLTYVSLFSQLVAGPIVRFRQIEEDLERIDHPPKEEQVAVGIGFFVVGLIKKCVIADSIAKEIDPMLAAYSSMSVAAAWAAALGYTFQLYYDFSGYSDMAIGLGHLFGIRIPQNFDSPYQAIGIRDFWRRWHISLSSWLRDYLYIGLGGSRRGEVRTNLNLMLTMLLGGLWHGASWTFVAWGAYHGLLLVCERAYERFWAAVPVAIRRSITFLLVIFGWVLFRSATFEMARVWLRKMFGGAAFSGGVTVPLLFWVVLCLPLVHLLKETWYFQFPTTRRWAVAYASAFFLAYLFMNGAKTVFLYYQF
jgi:alginate O-acetyltransferase complex protein AlgI